MSFVITADCIDEKAGECLDVCPVDCIEEGHDQYYINPRFCIDCGACEVECPVGAIVWEDDLKEDEKIYLEKAIRFFKDQ